MSEASLQRNRKTYSCAVGEGVRIEPFGCTVRVVRFSAVDVELIVDDRLYGSRSLTIGIGGEDTLQHQRSGTNYATRLAYNGTNRGRARAKLYVDAPAAAKLIHQTKATRPGE